MKRSTFLIALATLATAPAWADPTYPNKPIRIIVPFTPGGSPDVLARTIGQKITESTGSPVVIENVPGAGGTIGADRVAKAPADGYTLLMGHVGTLAVAPAVYPNLPYDPIKSFAPVAWVAKVPNVLAVHPSMPANNVAELVKYLKANPGKVNYGSGGSAFGYGVFQALHPNFCGPCALPRHGTFGDRCRGWTNSNGVHRRARVGAYGQGWQVARHCRV